MSALRAALPSSATLTEDDDFDILVMNGEGSMHHDSGPCRIKMRELSDALKRGRKAFLVNSVWQENSVKLNTVLERLDRIVLRETCSRDDLLLRHGMIAEVHPDLALQAQIDPNAEGVDCKGRVVMTDFYSRDFTAFVRITDGLLRRVDYINMKRLTWSAFVKSLSTSSLLITGRHHAVMAACKARVPFVALSGNTHKIEGFLRTAGSQIPVCRSPNELNNAREWALDNKPLYDELFDWVDSLPKWRLVL